MSDSKSAGGATAAGDGLDVIQDERRKVVIFRGEKVEILPLTIGQFPAFTRAARPIVDDLVAAVRDKAEKLSIAMAFDWVERHGETLVEAVAVATRRDRAWIAGGAMDEFVSLLLATISINLDFFVNRLLPMLAADVSSLDEIREQLPGSGRTSSSS